MAVSLNTPNAAGLRSDYMISDAMMAQRNADAAQANQQEQGSRFEEMLAKIDGKEHDLSDVQEAIDNGKYDVPTIEELEEAGVIYVDKETGRIYPENPRDMAMKVLKGEIDTENIPVELLTPEFLRAISELQKENPDNEDFEDLFAEFEETLKKDCSKDAQNSGVLAELAELIKAMTGEQDPENAQLVEETPSDSVIAQIVASHSGAQREEAQPKLEQKQQSSEGNFDEFVMSGQSEEIPEGAKQVPEELKDLGEEQLKVLNEAAKSGEISDVEQRQVEAPEKTQAEAPEKMRAEAPEEKQNDTLEVKTVEAPEAGKKAEEIPENNARTESKASTISEELEMLKNAKTKPNSEQSAPVNAANPLNADSPIVFRREDGEISIRPSEIVSQAMKAVEAAISENKEMTEYSLVLNPEEMGRITVKLIKAADGAVSVSIAAENARTQRILEQHSELMQSNLKDSGVQLESWQTVRESQQEAYAQDYNGSSKNPYFSQQDQDNNDEDENGQSFAEIIASM